MTPFRPVRIPHHMVFASLALVCSCVAVCAETQPDEKAQPAETEEPRIKIDGKKMHLPFMVIDLEKRCVDVEATVCLDEGMLELIACTKGTKTHESIVAVLARPMHIHTGLLLIGANNGNPAMSRPIDEARARWMHLPPRGDPIDVYLVIKDKDGKQVERPISDFVQRIQDDEFAEEEDEDEVEEVKFPKTFLFAGSHLHDNEKGKRKYVADVIGNVISISTFGDEVLCLPGIHDRANGELVWEVNDEHLPAVGSKVTLRLRLKAKPDPKSDKPSPGTKP